MKLDYNRDCKLEVGAYCQVHRDTKPRNDTEQYRTIGAIVLGRNNNMQGGYRFMNLTTGREINSHQWNGPLPLTDAVIDSVDELAVKEQHNFIFWDRNQNPLDDDDNNIAGVESYSVITGVDSDNDSDYAESDNESNNSVIVENTQEENDNDDDSILSANMPNLDQRHHVYNIDSDDDESVADSDDEDDDEDNNSKSTDNEVIEIIEEAEDYFSTNHFDPETVYGADEEDNVDDEYSPESKTDSDENSSIIDHQNQPVEWIERPKRGPKPNTLHYKPSFDNKAYEKIESSNVNIGYEPTDDELWGKIFTQVVSDKNFMNQFSLNKGIKEFGEKGKEAAFGELNQLHHGDAFKPLHPNELIYEQKRRALETIVLIEEKRDGRIKGRAVADGRKQRGHVAKEDAASPTAALESIILTSIIDAKEGREVAVCDIPNAFIQTDMEGDTVIMKLRDKAAEILVQTAPEIYRKYITIENGKVVLYVEALKALYGTLRAALLFYKKLLKDLKSIGFELNPYDACVANKMINGKQFTVVWHDDDLKISHYDARQIDEFINWLREMYEDDVGKIKVSRGKVHDYLGMTLDFSSEGKVKINMTEYVKKMVEAFPEKRDSEALTPAALHLFEVRDSIDKLKEEDAIIFHNIVARGLFLCKRARPDIQTTIAFLTTRVSNPDLDDWKKLRRMIDYLRGTQDLILTLSADNAMIIKWFVDVSYAVHKDMKSHTGGCLTLGKGFPIASSLKQKLNTKSSTESELVGTDDMMGGIIWTNYFLKAQGYDFTETIVYQDNRSAILLEKNGKASSGKRTKHINIRYFFIKDRIDNGEIKVEYCPTDEMTADFFTKPLQGKKFIQFRNEIMGIED